MFHHTTTVPPVAPELAGVPGVRVVHAAFADLDAIMDVEQRAYPIPWTRLNFADILAHPAQYAIQLLWDERLPDAPPSLIGYFVVMQGVQEAHLLNIAVHPDYQGQGWSVFLLRQLCYWALWHQARQVWLEVRTSNPHAHRVYERFGFRAVGRRKNYYPAVGGGREDAIVMCCLLDAPSDSSLDGC